MSRTTFDNSYYFANETYDLYFENVYNSSSKQTRNEFSEFLVANFKEMEFKKKKDKQKSMNTYEYQFDEDKKQKIRITELKRVFQITAMYDNEQNDEIKEQFVDKDNDEQFAVIMDQILDALEITELSMFGLECKSIKTKTPKKNKQSSKKSKKKMEIDEYSDEYEPTADEETEDENKKAQTKRRSTRSNSKKRKRNEIEDLSDVLNKTKLKNKFKKELKTFSDDDEDDFSRNTSIKSQVQPKKKKRKEDKSDIRNKKRKFVQLWTRCKYVEAIHCAENELNITAKEINDWVEEIYDYGL